MNTIVIILYGVLIGALLFESWRQRQRQTLLLSEIRRIGEDLQQRQPKGQTRKLTPMERRALGLGPPGSDN